MENILSYPIARRKIITLVLGVAFWFLCAYLAFIGDTSLQESWTYWWSALMWNIVYNRFLIWVFVLIFWIFTVHPIMWFKLKPILRWALIWTIVSIDMVFWAFIINNENAVFIARMTILAWAFYWAVIDVVATKFWWEWKDLLFKEKKKGFFS